MQQNTGEIMENFERSALQLRKEVIKKEYSSKIDEVLEGKSQEYKIGFLAGWELSDKFSREIEDAMNTADKISEEGED
jgi:hypothetical protein